MKLNKIVILALALLLSLSMSAQKRKKRVVKKKPVVEIPQEDPRITSMREMTQQIVIIDSIVTDKENILPFIHLSDETGTLTTHKDFFQKGNSDSTFVFLNEMRNKIYFSLPDDSLRQQLYTSDKLGNEWSQAQPLKGINEGLTETACPFMLTDGITIYFAGKGEESIGGYDIFFTRYDAHNSTFYKPENIGMPFNSEANDYLYVIDEYNRIGYFVSDRRQPEGKVCIYIFIPADTRQTYDTAIYSEQQLRDLSDIARIADTWGNGKEREAALKRLNATLKNVKSKKGDDNLKNTHPIVINDNVTYTELGDFHSNEAAILYKQLVSAQEQLDMIEKELEDARDDYAKASRADRQGYSREILQAERQCEELHKRINMLTKQIRNKENKVINQ